GDVLGSAGRPGSERARRSIGDRREADVRRDRVHARGQHGRRRTRGGLNRSRGARPDRWIAAGARCEAIRPGTWWSLPGRMALGRARGLSNRYGPPFMGRSRRRVRGLPAKERDETHRGFQATSSSVTGCLAPRLIAHRTLAANVTHAGSSLSRGAPSRSEGVRLAETSGAMAPTNRAGDRVSGPLALGNRRDEDATGLVRH